MSGSESPPMLDAAPEHGRSGGLAARWSDRCNPILVRELQQALAGRSFLFLLGLAVTAVLLLAMVAVGSIADDRAGRRAFSYAMVGLVPLAMLMVPTQAFQSMRLEVQGGLAEQLAMTRLRPRAILTGKLLAAQVQLLLFLAVFAPYVAMTWLLRGIDVVTIAVSLTLVVLLNLVATAFAIAGGAACRSKVSQGFAQALVSLTLVFGILPTVWLMVELPYELPSWIRSGEIWEILGWVLLSTGLAIGLFATVGTAALSHEYENRSTPFRLWLTSSVILSVCGLVGIAAFDAPPGGSAVALAEGLTWAALLGLPIWLWAVCESPRFSPRVRAHVPNSPLMAIAVAPWLPGGARGAAFVLGLTALVLGLGFGTPLLLGEGIPRAIHRAGSTTGFRLAGEHRVLLAVWAYVLFYAGVARGYRRRLADGPRAARQAFVLTIMTAVLAFLLPITGGLLIAGDVPHHGSIWFLLNPLSALGAYRPGHWLEGITWVLAGVGVLLLLRDVPAAFREVLEASAARRRRAG